MERQSPTPHLSGRSTSAPSIPVSVSWAYDSVPSDPVTVSTVHSTAPPPMTVAAPKMAPFREDEDIEHYLTTFERIAMASRWPMDIWALYLVPLLSGKARAAYVAMDVRDVQDYAKVKRAILAKFEIDSETYRQRFRSKQVLEGETPRELQARLRDLFQKWACPQERSTEEVAELIILEQFLWMVNPEIRTWIKEHNPQSATHASELAETYLSARRGRRGLQLGNVDFSSRREQRWSNVDFSSRREQEDSRDSGQAATSRSGGGTGSVFRRSRYTKDRPATHTTPRARVVCHKCGQPGHISPECPIGPSTASNLCYSPQPHTSHPSRPDRTGVTVPVGLRGRKWEGLVDSGSSQTFVQRRCLGAQDMTAMGKVKVRCIHGDIREYDAVEVTLEIDGQAYVLNVGVMDESPYPVVIGQDVPVLAELLQWRDMPATAYVTTRAQTKSQADLSQGWSELPFSVSGNKERKGKTERRRSKVRGTRVVENIPCPPVREEEIVGDFEAMQRADPTLQPLFKKAIAPEQLVQFQAKGKECHLVKGGKLFRVSEDGEQLVVPQSLRSTVLKVGHSVPWAGHLGQQKTLSRIAQRFHWPGFYQHVIDYCKSCPECQLTSQANRGTKAPLVSLPIVDVPFTRIAMDIVGPLERSRGGHRYILVVCDYATRYPEAFPLRNTKARQIANCLIQLFSRVGVLREILTDQGTNFSSRFLRQVYSLLDIRGIRTTPYHPQTDGMVERFNQTLKAMLRKFVNDTGSDWDQWLPYLLFAYREVPQASTGYSPFELLFGRTVRGPLDVLREAWEGEQQSQPTNIVNYVLRMRDKLEQLTTLVHENMAKAQAQQKSWYDRSAHSRSFEPGQKVMLLLPSAESSLLAKWQGPFEVLRKMGPVTYQISMPGRRKPQQVFHINLLKLWVPREEVPGNQLWAHTVLDEEELPEQDFPVALRESSLQLDHLSSRQQRELRRCIPKSVLRQEPGRTSLIQHGIRLTSPGPIRQTCYRVPAKLIPALREEVKSMLEAGVIKPSHSEWCSPVVLVPKKDGGLRFCVDFRKLNAIAAFDPYPMPRVDDLMERLGKAKFLSTLDMCKGYWQVPLTPEAQEMTAFRVPSGLYQFTVMPFGLHGAAATFQRLMDQVLRGAEDYAAAYIDDVVVHSSTWEEHMAHLRDVFDRIHQAGLVVNASKCHLAKPEVAYLGHVLGGGVVKPQLSKVDAIQSCPPPTTKRGVRSFLGLVGWYRRFIPDFSSRAAVLTDLTRKNAPNKVRWTESCEQAFRDLKDCMCQGPVLQSPNFDLPFVVQTDASGVGLGAVLLQGEGEDCKPIQYISRKLYPRETRYSTVEKECLAVKWALDTLRYYLIGKDFTLETDHRALQWLHKMKDANARVTRWYMSLQPYRFVVRYRAGKFNVVADYLSRLYEEGQS
ncbi:hypothetical protein ACEWY4_002222 [Coilia grayii]|uniref:Gypsy retrotransposon integrase-like protein 1 n=1 Tax=Coilia grayii TaxID=363190 RepID=A0ABD1KV73_9TELE